MQGLQLRPGLGLPGLRAAGRRLAAMVGGEVVSPYQRAGDSKSCF